MNEAVLLSRKKLWQEVSAAFAKRARWLWLANRVTSLWTPVGLVFLILAVYITIIEFSLCAYWVLLPGMKGVALGCVLAWWVLLLGRYIIAKPSFRLRRARVGLEESDKELLWLARKSPPSSLPPKALSEVAELRKQAWLAYVESDSEALLKATAKLQGAASKHFAQASRTAWRWKLMGLLGTLVLVVLLRLVVVEPYAIPSGSMIPTLEIGDHVVVNRFLYGVRIPYKNIVPFVLVREPKRGDVIVFNNPTNTEVDYIKRVIGIAGDVVELRNKKLFVNGEAILTQTETENYPYMTYDFRFGWEKEEAELAREFLGSHPHRVLFDWGFSKDNNEGPYKVPDKHVFVMGDNRDHSDDSRYGLGSRSLQAHFVPLGNIKGKAMVVWWAWGLGGWGGGLLSERGLRVDRLFLPMNICGKEPSKRTGLP
ncbi:MAG: signal peptidase I [Proteobacteria bacterium]|nr:signal peptidase I [Cystobacterineae bacterium]MCL2258640.1 signal peptidase I [Cystobacterineae bacterium]MCL2314945.1 signal peptidase I [Pseudomonadota bacterium]